MTDDAPPVVTRKKLIEVALPLEAINRESIRDKSLRHWHPSTMHLWWARRPLPAARAVIFAQLVDDPSAIPEEFPTEADQERERQRLFKILEELVTWENTTNEVVLNQARAEIKRSWQRACADNAPPPGGATELFDPDALPTFHDPFAGGGSLPLEAQRLGLEAHASDLNPVAVLICKAMIEIPPKFAGLPPVNPETPRKNRLLDKTWRGAEGLAEDVRYYGRWMRDEAKKRIGHLYPKVHITEDMACERADLRAYVGRDLTVVAWLWARTVKSPNPRFAHVDVPLATTFILSKKGGHEAYVEPVIEADGYRFTVNSGPAPEWAKLGTSAGRRKAFRCLMSRQPIDYDHIRTQGQAGQLGVRLMAIVAEGKPGKVYLPPLQEHQALDYVPTPTWRPTLPLAENPRNFQTPNYGMSLFGDLFVDRQLVALTTFSDLVTEARDLIRDNAVEVGIPDDGVPVRDGGRSATAYAESVASYLAFAVDRSADYWSSIATWHNSGQKMRNTFSRQAIQMSWDYAEANPFSQSSGYWMGAVSWIQKAIQRFPARSSGLALQLDAAGDADEECKHVLISTDPPYYDNIAYADLSDFFYVWLRRSMRSQFPSLFSTIASPRGEELIAMAYRHDGREDADSFFLEGMSRAIRQLTDQSHPATPITIFYAFKQAENRGDDGIVSTGWEVFLDALIRAGLAITATWPIRTELPNRTIADNANALASSIVLACRPRADEARPSGTPPDRTEFEHMLRDELSEALAHLRRSSIPPVDLAQASIGPGMAVFTRYPEVLNADGSRMSIGKALALINTILANLLTEQLGDLDPDSSWARIWFATEGYDEAEFGKAEQLATSQNIAVEGLRRAGLIASHRGKVRLLRPSELDPNWDPKSDSRLTVWEMMQHLIRLLEIGERAAAELLAKLGSEAEIAKDLATDLYVVSERTGRAADALAFNGLVQSWPEIVRLAGELRRSGTQDEFDLGGD